MKNKYVVFFLWRTGDIWWLQVNVKAGKQEMFAMDLLEDATVFDSYSEALKYAEKANSPAVAVKRVLSLRQEDGEFNFLPKADVNSKDTENFFVLLFDIFGDVAWLKVNPFLPKDDVLKFEWAENFIQATNFETLESALEFGRKSVEETGNYFPADFFKVLSFSREEMSILEEHSY